MKDRALRRHQDLRVKRRNQKNYNSCIGDDLPQSKKQRLENNVEKLKKVCVMSHFDRHTRKAAQKTVQEMKHDITMQEQLSVN